MLQNNTVGITQMNKEIYNEFLELGKINFLLIERETEYGFFLVAQNNKEVLLPNAYVTKDMKIGDVLEVFLYTDSEDRLVATTQRPKAILDEYGIFEVVDTTKFGAFVDWGLPKDLLVPTKLQKTPFKVGEKRFLKVAYDEKTHRLVGSEKLGDFLDTKIKGLKPNNLVDILVIARTPLGFKCIVQNQYEGLLYHNELFENVDVGDKKRAQVKTIRTDGKIDLKLIKKDPSQVIIEKLESAKKTLPYNYKSDAELIKSEFEMSKKEFKKTLTKLQDNKKIIVKENGITLIS